MAGSGHGAPRGRQAGRLCTQPKKPQLEPTRRRFPDSTGTSTPIENPDQTRPPREYPERDKDAREQEPGQQRPCLQAEMEAARGTHGVVGRREQGSARRPDGEERRHGNGKGEGSRAGGREDGKKERNGVGWVILNEIRNEQLRKEPRCSVDSPALSSALHLVLHPARPEKRSGEGLEPSEAHCGGGGEGRGGGGQRRRRREERGVLLGEELLHAQHEQGGDRGVVDGHGLVGDVGWLQELRGVVIRAVPSPGRAAAAKHAVRLVEMAQAEQRPQPRMDWRKDWKREVAA
ncbi:hypothetical protein ZWY2020_027747 [Hordeum vulgare]|nr:hypothetical protein ZWY2020_027747 [Hordeum vulgare]